MKKIFALFLFSLCFAAAADEEIDIDNMTLADILMNTKTSVASQKASNTLTSPGIISVIPADEIEKLGARDLLDVLYMVPGFNINGEIYHIDGLSVRGIYSVEGRALLMIDGIMINDLSYGNFSFGHRYPVDQIERIEVIRGPGSAIYGGFAELAVINVITKGAAGKKGTEVGVVYGQMPKTFARRGISLRTAGGETWKYDFAAYWAEGNRSDKKAQLQDGGGGVVDYSMKDSSSTYPLYFNAGVQRGGFSARVLIDDFDIENRQGYGYQLLPTAYNTAFHNYALLAKYDWKITPTLTLTPSYFYKEDFTWGVVEEWTLAFNDYYFDNTFKRHQGELKLVWDPFENLNLVFGASYATDSAHAREPTEAFADGTRDLDFHSVALYTQGLLETAWANLTFGLRFEDHSAFDNALVPRFAATRQFGAFHLKGLYSQAFRNPAMKNIDSFNFATDSLRPEEVTTYELEAGYQLTSNQALVANVFDTTIRYPLVYVSASDSYEAADEMGTRGFEAEYRVRGGWGFGTLSYSYYRVMRNDVASWRPFNAEKETLGNPPHKFTALGSFKLTPKLSLTPSVIYLGKAWSSVYDAATFNDSTDREVGATWLVNLSARVQALGGIKGLDASVGVFNLLNQKHNYLLSYRSEADDLPAPSSEAVLRVNYSLEY